MEASEMIFIGVTKFVVALDRTTGKTLWQFEAKKGKAYPALLVDGDRLIASFMGYTYCLDVYTGRVLWENELPHMGVGVACIATARASTNPSRAAASAIQQQQAAAAAGA